MQEENKNSANVESALNNLELDDLDQLALDNDFADIEDEGDLISDADLESGVSSDEEFTKPYSDKNILMQELISTKAAVEAIVFASAKPIKAFEVLEILQDERITTRDIIKILDELVEFYALHAGGFRLENLKGMGYQFRTVPVAAPLMEAMFSKRARPLSRAALESLAIIAYKQPITRAEIEFIRGVDAGSAIKNLMDRNIVRCVGRKADAGRPMLFGTGEEFLKIYQISSLADLPSLDSFQVSPEVLAQAKEKLKTIGEHVAVEEFIGDNGASDEIDLELAVSTPPLIEDETTHDTTTKMDS